MSLTDIQKIPGLQPILDKCFHDIQQATGKKVSVVFKLIFREVDAAQLRHIICKACEVSWEQLAGESRKGSVIIARQLYMYFARTVQRKSLQAIGGEINRDHTTVIMAVKKIENMIDTNDELYMPYIKIIEEQINKILLP